MDCSKKSMENSTSPFLEIVGLSKTIAGRVVVDGISTEIKRFEKLAITGETGSGKSTLLKLIYGLEQPDGGFIKFLNQKIKGPDFQLIAGHPEIGYLDQYAQLPKHYYIRDLVFFKNEFTEEETLEILKICKIDHLIDRKTSALSGGEKQRISLALQLLNKPLLLLLDEPFSNLDSINKRIVHKALDEISTKLNLTIVLVSHDIEDILSWADRIIILKEGGVVQDGTTQHVYHHPINEYCAELLGYYTVIEKNDFPYLFQSEIVMGSNTSEEKLYLRPHQIQFQKSEATDESWVVCKSIFAGSYTLSGIEIHNNMVWALSEPEEFSVGDRVKITFKVNNSSKLQG